MAGPAGAHAGITLTPDQAEIIRLALDDAKWSRIGKLTGCAACAAAGPEAACSEHRPDAQQAEAYDALGRELFGEDFGIQEAVTPRPHPHLYLTGGTPA